MSTQVYNIDDLIRFTHIGRFGHPEMNQLAFSAFVELKKKTAECEELKKKLASLDPQTGKGANA